MTDVHLEYVNSAYMRINCDPGILMELSDELTFYADNYKFHPKYKARMWDGKLRLINRMTRLVYAGLAQRIKKICDARNYTFSFDDEMLYDNISVNEVKTFIASLNLPSELQVRDYQLEAVVKCLRSKRRTLLSPTSSGKSLIIFIINEWYRQKQGTKSLIIVPTTSLVTQMQNDFISYGYKGTFNTSIGGLDKNYNHNFDTTITTWQSLDNGRTKQPKEWYRQFDVVFGDEAHGAKATSMVKILTNMINTPYRFGTTGTLDNSELNKHTIYGLFGPPYQTTTTRELIDDGHAANITIKCIVLKYPEEERKQFQKDKHKYPDEAQYITQHEKRTKFIKNLVLSLEGNKLIFFRLTDHGQSLYKAFEDKENVFYIDGSVTSESRENIRQSLEHTNNAILIASLGTTSTGVSIKKLHHMIAASPSKSKIKVLQSIGRMLRQHKDKERAILYDIVDDLSYKSSKNFALKHFEERMKIYDAELFDVKYYTLSMK